MPRARLKRRESLIKFARRAALEALDRTAARLEPARKADAAAAAAALREMRFLVQLLREPLGPVAYARDHAALDRLLRRLDPAAGRGLIEAAQTLSRLADTKPALSVPDECTPRALSAAQRKGRGRREPARLRTLADVAELRLRARHWHLSETGFASLAAPLRRACRLAASGRGAGAAALAHHLHCLDRMWPEALAVPRESAHRMARAAQRIEALTALEVRLPESPDHDPLRARLTAHRDTLRKVVTENAARLGAETPAAFSRRLHNYWNLWRGEPQNPLPKPDDPSSSPAG